MTQRDSEKQAINVSTELYKKKQTKNKKTNNNKKTSEQSKIVKYSNSVCKLNLVRILIKHLVRILIRQHNFQYSQTGCVCISIGQHKFYVFPNGIHRGAEKNMFLNLNNFFLGALEKSEWSKV